MIEELLKNESLMYTVGGKVQFGDCGDLTSSECFFSHYNSYGWFDFLNVLSYPVALFACAGMDEYEYGFCFSNFFYVLTDAFMRDMAPYKEGHSTHNKYF
jgi:hypothetical protein